MSNVINLFEKNKLPVIMQSEGAECGLACLAMVANYYGHKISLHELRDGLSVSLKGLNLRGMIQTADKLNLNSRPIRIEIEDIKQLQKPAILHWEFDHFVVLKKVTGNYVYIHDPALGECKYSVEEFSLRFTGVALELYPTVDFKVKKKQSTLKLKTLFKNIFGVKSVLAQIFVLTLALQLLTLLIPYFTQIVVDNVLITQDVDFLLIIAFSYIFIVSFRSLAWILRSWVILHLSSNLSVHLLSRMFRHLLSLPVDFFSKRHVGDIQSRFMSMEEIRDTLTTDFIEGVVDGLMMVITLTVMFFYSPLLSLIVLTSVCLYFLAKQVTFKKLKRRLDENIVSRAYEDSLFLESIRGIVPLKNFGKESKRQSVWMNAYTNALNSHVKVAKFDISYSTFFEFVSGVEQVVLVWLAAYLIMDETFTVGMLLAYIAYRNRLSDHARSLIDKIFQLRLMTIHIQRISDVLLTSSEENYSGVGFINERHQNIRINNVSFSYSANEANVLNKVDFTVNQGESVCIVGASGCGKSTLLKVLLGLVAPDKGKVEVDGQDILKCGLRNYREKIAVVMQDDSLFSGSIRDNITMFDPKPDDSRLKKCTMAASIFNDINNMPMGFSSLVGDMGSSLSGGQKQRLLIARALYAEPEILFLDEATSHLDMITERKVNKAIKKLGVTTIMVAHRKETIDLADRIINLSELNSAKQDLAI